MLNQKEYLNSLEEKYRREGTTQLEEDRKSNRRVIFSEVGAPLEPPPVPGQFLKAPLPLPRAPDHDLSYSES